VYLIDRREHDDLDKLLPDGIVVTLDFGDISISGNGPDGLVSVGFERKKIRDLVNCIATGRLGGFQIPGMLKEYFHSYLIVEGVWKDSKDGMLVLLGRLWKNVAHGKRVFHSADVHKYLNTISVMSGVTVLYTESPKDTANRVMVLHDWWNRPWSSHHSLTGVYKPPVAGLFGSISKPSFLKKVAMDLPGVGNTRAGEVEKKFRTFPCMMSATEKEWATIPGIGKKSIEMVMRVLHGDDPDV
jgi:ERCC4-type nuclease